MPAPPPTRADQHDPVTSYSNQAEVRVSLSSTLPSSRCAAELSACARPPRALVSKSVERCVGGSTECCGNEYTVGAIERRLCRLASLGSSSIPPRRQATLAFNEQHHTFTAAGYNRVRAGTCSCGLISLGIGAPSAPPTTGPSAMALPLETPQQRSFYRRQCYNQEALVDAPADCCPRLYRARQTGRRRYGRRESTGWETSGSRRRRAGRPVKPPTFAPLYSPTHHHVTDSAICCRLLGCSSTLRFALDSSGARAVGVLRCWLRWPKESSIRPLSPPSLLSITSHPHPPTKLLPNATQYDPLQPRQAGHCRSLRCRRPYC